MRRGDISDSQPPRVLLQWEHFLAVPRPVADTMLGRIIGGLRRRQEQHFSPDAMEPHEHAVKIAWDCSTRRGLRVDAWTQWPHEVVPAIRDWCVDWGVPVHRVLACSHEQLEREIMRQPHIFAVYHCGDGRPLAFGGRGVYAATPAEALVLG